MTPKDTIEKSLIELKIQLHNEEINAETFLDTVATLREMFIRSGRRQIDWMMLTSQAEKAFIAILEQEQERRQEQAQTS